MASNKELLDAAAFHRHRVVAALLSGSPYDEPARVLRAVVAGLVVALAIVAGVLVARYLGAS